MAQPPRRKGAASGSARRRKSFALCELPQTGRCRCGKFALDLPASARNQPGNSCFKLVTRAQSGNIGQKQLPLNVRPTGKQTDKDNVRKDQNSKVRPPF